LFACWSEVADTNGDVDALLHEIDHPIEEQDAPGDRRVRAEKRGQDRDDMDLTEQYRRSDAEDSGCR
jgi:hypothetical protein